MAIDFASVKIHSRSKGDSAVAASAYRSASKLYDERTGQTFDYKNKEQVIYSSVILPDAADDNFKDREYLWNEVEKSEKKSNARVSKDIIIALPKELSEKEWIELSRRYTEEEFTSKGLAADISIHKNENNPHCHILVTTRRLLGKKFDTHKARDLDGNLKTSKYGNFSTVNNLHNDKWRNLQNKYYEEKNIDLTVDQNYLISQKHEGRVSTYETHYLKEINKVRLEQSKEIALNNPDLMVTILTKRETVFSEKDIESIAYKHSDSKEEFEKIKTSIINHEKVQKLGLGNDGRIQYSTKYAIEKENKLIDNAKKLSNNNSHSVNKKSVEKVINKTSLSEDQQRSLNHITSSNDISVVVGKPGTGKSYMLNSAREVWEENGYRVNGASVSGVATEGLEKSASINSRVIASLNYRIENGQTKLSEKDILVIDEAGMVDTYDLEKLITHTKENGAKIVLVGDADQLQPVGPGASFKALMEEVGYEEMSEIRRQKIQWQKEATSELAKGNSKGIDAYYKNNKVFISDTRNDGISDLVNDWSKNITKENIDESIIIAHRNSDVLQLNEEARNSLISKNIIDSSSEKNIETDKGKLKISIGEKILFTKRDRKLGINNGTFGTVTNIGDGSVQLEIKDGDSLKSIDINLEEYNNISHGYASTVHKLQGTTFEESYIYAGGKSWNKNLALVALSRHRNDAKLYGDKETFKDYDELKRAMTRDGYKDSVLEYPVSYSLRRGIDPDSVAGRAVNKLAGIKENISDKWNWLFNYQKYLEKQKLTQKHEELLKQRKEAVKVASYIDERHKLYDYRNKLNSELKDKERLYQHNNYHDYYLKQTELNKSAYHLYTNYEKYEKALNLNNLDITDLKNGADTYLKQQTVRDFILCYNTKDTEGLEYYSNEISKDYRSYYSHFVHLNTTDDLKTENISSYIRKQSIIYNYKEVTAGKDQDFIGDSKEIKKFYDIECKRKEFWQKSFNNRKLTFKTNSEITVIDKFDLTPKRTKEIGVNLSEEQKNEINKINYELRKTAFELSKIDNIKDYDKVLEVLKLDKTEIEKRSYEFTFGEFNKSRIDNAKAWNEYKKDKTLGAKEKALLATEKRNLAAYDIVSDFEKYSDLIGKSKLTEEAIRKYADAGALSRENISRINQYVDSYTNGNLDIFSQSAYKITSKDENYLIQLKLACEDKNIDYQELKKSLEIDSYKYYTKNMNESEFRNLHIVKDFKSSYSEYIETLSRNHSKGFDNLLENEKKHMYKLSSSLEQKAHRIYDSIEDSRNSLKYYHIKEDSIIKYEEKYQKSILRNEVRNLKDARASSGRLWHETNDKTNEQFTRNLSGLIASSTTFERDNIAFDISKDIEKYKPYLEKFKISEQDVKKYAARKIVTDFNELNIATAKAWKMYSDSSNKDSLKTAIDLSTQRNEFAYKISEEPEKFREFFIKKDERYIEKFKKYVEKHIAIDSKDTSENLSNLFGEKVKENKKINSISDLSVKTNGILKEYLEKSKNHKAIARKFIMTPRGHSDYHTARSKCEESSGEKLNLAKKLVNDKAFMEYLKTHSKGKRADSGINYDKLSESLNNGDISISEATQIMKSIKQNIERKESKARSQSRSESMGIDI
jgi:Ti-type conjugative transfer relaxase TraA